MGFSHFLSLGTRPEDVVQDFQSKEGSKHIVIDWNNFVLSFLPQNNKKKKTLASTDDCIGHVMESQKRLIETCEYLISTGCKIIAVTDGLCSAERSIIKIGRDINLVAEGADISDGKETLEGTDNVVYSQNLLAVAVGFRLAKRVLSSCTNFTMQKAKGEADPEIRCIVRGCVERGEICYIFSGDSSLVLGVAKNDIEASLVKFVPPRHFIALVPLFFRTKCQLYAISLNEFVIKLNREGDDLVGVSLPTLQYCDLPLLSALLGDERGREGANAWPLCQFVMKWLFDRDIFTENLKKCILVSTSLLIRSFRKICNLADGDLIDPETFTIHAFKSVTLASTRSSELLGEKDPSIQFCSKYLRGTCPPYKSCLQVHASRDQIDSTPTVPLCQAITSNCRKCKSCCRVCRYGGCKMLQYCFYSHNIERRGAYISNSIFGLRRINMSPFRAIGLHEADSTAVAAAVVRSVKLQDADIDAKFSLSSFTKVWYEPPDENGPSLLSPLTSLRLQLRRLSHLSKENFLSTYPDPPKDLTVDTFNSWWGKIIRSENENISVITRAKCRVDKDGRRVCFGEFVNHLEPTLTLEELYLHIDQGHDLPHSATVSTACLGLEVFFTQIDKNEIPYEEKCTASGNYCSSGYSNSSGLLNLQTRAKIFHELCCEDAHETKPDVWSLLRILGIANISTSESTDKVRSLWRKLGVGDDICDSSCAEHMLATLFIFSAIFTNPDDDDWAQEGYVEPRCISSRKSKDGEFQQLHDNLIEALLLSPVFVHAAANCLSENSLQKLKKLSKTISQFLVTELKLPPLNKGYCNLLALIENVACSVYKITSAQTADKCACWFDSMGILASLMMLEGNCNTHLYDTKLWSDPLGVPTTDSTDGLREAISQTKDSISKWLAQQLATVKRG